MTNTNEEQLGIIADPEEVSALLQEISLNRGEIATFLDAVTPQTTFLFCAWFLGQIIVQQPAMLQDFRRALEVSLQVAGVMHAGQEKNTENLVLIYPPSPSNESQLSLADATGWSVQ